MLGFEILGYFLDPPVYSIVRRDSVEIDFGKTETGTSHSGNSGHRPEGLDAYIWVTNLDPLYQELKGRAAKIVQGPPRVASTSVTKSWWRTISVFDWLSRGTPAVPRPDVDRPRQRSGIYSRVLK
jgi:hypothetical protein